MFLVSCSENHCLETDFAHGGAYAIGRVWASRATWRLHGLNVHHANRSKSPISSNIRSIVFPRKCRRERFGCDFATSSRASSLNSSTLERRCCGRLLLSHSRRYERLRDVLVLHSRGRVSTFSREEHAGRHAGELLGNDDGEADLCKPFGKAKHTGSLPALHVRSRSLEADTGDSRRSRKSKRIRVGLSTDEGIS